MAATIETLRQEVQNLRAENEALKDKVKAPKKDSHNSSRPPSSDRKPNLGRRKKNTGVKGKGSFRITESSLRNMSLHGLADEVVEKLRSLEGQLFSTGGEFEAALAKVLSAAELAEHGKFIQNYARKKGPPVGHPGKSRVRKPNADLVIVKKLEECPRCAAPIDSNSETYDQHQVLELPPLKLLVIDILRQQTTCPNCRTTVTAPNPEGISDHAVFGPRFETYLALLRHEYRVGYQKTRTFVLELCEERVSEGLVDNALNRVWERLSPGYESLLQELRDSKVVGLDETGWRINGKNGWAWTAQNEQTTYYTIERRRNSEVVKKILGEDYQGTLVTDFFSAYGPILAGAKQKCVGAHLLRDLEYGCETEKAQGETFCQNTRQIILDAIRLAKERDEMDRETYRNTTGELEERLDQELTRELSNEDGKRLQKRLKRHREELFPFLYDPDIPSDNNGSERAVRVLVMQRKISNGSRSEEGAKRTATITSIIETVKKRGGRILQGVLEKAGVVSTIGEATLLIALILATALVMNENPGLEPRGWTPESNLSLSSVSEWTCIDHIAPHGGPPDYLASDAVASALASDPQKWSYLTLPARERSPPAQTPDRIPERGDIGKGE